MTYRRRPVIIILITIIITVTCEKRLLLLQRRQVAALSPVRVNPQVAAGGASDRPVGGDGVINHCEKKRRRWQVVAVDEKKSAGIFLPLFVCSVFAVGELFFFNCIWAFVDCNNSGGGGADATLCRSFSFLNDCPQLNI